MVMSVHQLRALSHTPIMCVSSTILFGLALPPALGIEWATNRPIWQGYCPMECNSKIMLRQHFLRVGRWLYGIAALTVRILRMAETWEREGREPTWREVENNGLTGEREGTASQASWQERPYPPRLTHTHTHLGINTGSTNKTLRSCTSITGTHTPQQSHTHCHSDDSSCRGRVCVIMCVVHNLNIGYEYH